MADKYGGAKVTILLIVWCTVATVCTGILIERTYTLQAWFVFMFISLFFGVMFDKDLAGPVLGWSSAIASYGAFIIPSMFQVAIKAGNAQIVLYSLAAFYFLCGLLNYWYYLRPGCERPGV